MKKHNNILVVALIANIIAANLIIGKYVKVGDYALVFALSEVFL